MQSLYYKPSGKFSPISFLYLILAIGIGATILAFIYTYAILYIPLIYLNFLCVIGVAFGLGFVANFAVGMGKVRNKALAVVFGLLVGIAGLYMSWVIWIADHFDLPYMDIAMNIEGIQNAIGYANEQGTWGIGRSGGNVDGVMLTIVWIIEALAMILVPMYFAFSKAAEPFLENDDDWAEITKIGPYEFIPNGDIIKRQLEASNYEELLAMLPAENAGQGSHTMLDLYHGKNRGQSKEFYLSINNMIERRDKDGKLEFDEKLVVNFIRISKEAGQQLIAKITTNEVVANKEE